MAGDRAAGRGSLVLEQSGLQQFGGAALAAFGATIFIGFALFMGEPLYLLVFGFFGLVMAAGAISAFRRGTNRTLIEVDAGGLWLPGMGRLAWSAIEEVRLEEVRGISDGELTATTGYRRLGVVPTDPRLRPDLATRSAVALVRGFAAFVTREEPNLRLWGHDLAPFGLSESETTPSEFDAAVAVVGRYMPVVDAAARRARERAPARWAANVEPSLTPAALAAIDARLAPDAVSQRVGGPGAEAPLAPASLRREPSATFVAQTFAKPSLPGAAAFLIGPLVFVVGFATFVPGGLANLEPGYLVFLGLAVVIPALLGVVPRLRRVLQARPGTTLMRLGPEGVWLPDMGQLSWDQVAIVRTERAGSARVSSGDFAERWRLVVVPALGTGRGRPFGITSDLLDAPFEDVLDLVRYYHPVEET